MRVGSVDVCNENIATLTITDCMSAPSAEAPSLSVTANDSPREGRCRLLSNDMLSKLDLVALKGLLNSGQTESCVLIYIFIS